MKSKSACCKDGKKILRFAISGLLVSLTHVTVSYTIIQLGLMDLSIANSFAFLIATLFSYFINTIWSFSSARQKKNFLRFLLVSFIGLLLVIVVSKITQHYELDYWYSICLVVCMVSPVYIFTSLCSDI